ncbi:SHOCT domain-containing protein [Streptomyces sp. KS 21]|uniref:SHOCT domain-containing protein n=1 Tax=Streptomyces sp. KS 21 TaxID=2485150 RepID=UPI00106394FC|nr:SHOCT domain-containing protein [Streptomyces sp. KS 21]TDU74684.1 putative oligomerization/nucleic acid binding protein [Streptomyces sp. KS 21]
MTEPLFNLAVDYPLLNMFWTMMLIFIWVLWFMLLFRIIGDIFRDDDLSGWGKTGWTILVIILPFLGVFVYLIARGRGMGERELRRAQRNEEEFRSYVQNAAGPSQSEELARLAELREKGHISATEFEQAKAKVLAT